MCRNSSEFRVRSLELLRRTLSWQHKRHSCESGNPGKKWIPCQARNDKIGLHKFLFIALFFAIFFTGTAHAEPLKISLLPGDTHTKTAVEAIKAVRSQGVKDISLHVYPLKGIRNEDLEYLKNSKLIIVNIMGRQIVDAVKSEIQYAIKNGAKSSKRFL